VVIPTVLVLLQPDLGTSVSYLAVLIAGAFLAGLRWKYVAVIAVSGGDRGSGELAAFSDGLSEGAVW